MKVRGRPRAILELHKTSKLSLDQSSAHHEARERGALEAVPSRETCLAARRDGCAKAMWELTVMARGACTPKLE